MGSFDTLSVPKLPVLGLFEQQNGGLFNMIERIFDCFGPTQCTLKSNITLTADILFIILVTTVFMTLSVAVCLTNG